LRIYQSLLNDLLYPHKKALLDACDLELHEDGDDFIKFYEFEDALTSIGVKLPENDNASSLLLNYLKVRYFTKINRKGFESDIGFKFKDMINDLRMPKQ
jgi:hypothetical protein